MIRGIHHTAISTGNLERSLAFYRDLLGFQEASSFAWDAGNDTVDAITGLRASAARVALLRTRNAFIELFEFSAPDPASGDPDRPVCDHGITHLCLEVEDIEGEYKRLSEAGMRFHCPPQDAGMGLRATYGRDPDGNVVELLEVLEVGSPFEIGGG